MNHSETSKTARATSSTDSEARTVTVNLTAPTSWKEMSQDQLRYVFDLMALGEDPTALKTLVFVRFCGLEVLRKTRFGWKCLAEVDGKRRIVYLHTWEVQSFLHQFDYIDQVENMDCRLDAVCGLHAVDPLLHGVSFETYLQAETYYQMCLSSEDDTMVDALACWLYTDDHGRHAGEDGCAVKDLTLTPGERIGTMLWYMRVKKVMSDYFTHFFRRTDAEVGAPSGRELLDMYNTQIRALTDGDVTKERQVLDLDCWRALTELDAKAREAEELERIRNKS